MRVPINLASHPRENLRPLRTGVIASGLVALVLGGFILSRELANRNEFRALIQQQTSLEASLRELGAQQAELVDALSTPETQLVRERSAFMNSLILRKSISWTQLFMDLEETLPAQARVVAIQPRLNAAEDVSLDLTISAASMQPLVEFLKNLETSPEFGPPVVGSTRYQTERSGSAGVELDLTARYLQNGRQSGSQDRSNEPAGTDASPATAPTAPDAPAQQEDSAGMLDEDSPATIQPEAEMPSELPETAMPDPAEGGEL